MSDSSERTAVVVGGASGFGRALANGLAARGARLTVADKASWITGEVIELCGGAQLAGLPDFLAHLERMTSG